MTLAAVLAWALAALQTAAALPFLIEVGAGLPARRRARPAPGSTAPPRLAILMPAHQEGRHIGAVLDALGAVSPAGTRVLVVADNCTDDTAAVARAHGAEVAERHDPARRGKGYALAFGRDVLAADPPDVVIVLDADCRAEPGALVRLGRAAQQSGGAVQGLYLLAPDRNAPAMVQVSNFAFVVKNMIRQRGLRRLGAPVPLGGTGMAFSWQVFAGAALASGHLVEDLELSIALAATGMPPRFEEQAGIWSMAADVGATAGQRARWEGGYLQTARTHGLSLLRAGLRRRKPALAWFGLHVLTPPLALLMAGEIGVAAMVAILSRLAWSHAAILSLAVLAALVGMILVAWATHGWRWLRLSRLLQLPFYLLWKLPLYLRLLSGRGPKAWVRTEREG